MEYGSALHQIISVLPFSSRPVSEQSVTRRIDEILRSSVYSITDSGCFDLPPQSESDVHTRIEAVLRCVYPDLKTKPVLTKPIKNFIPDTGIKSLKALIEYKYLADKKDAARIADEILADTRGYYSRDWNHFIYVIYETERFKAESEWRQLLRESDISENSEIIVLQGIKGKSHTHTSQNDQSG